MRNALPVLPTNANIWHHGNNPPAAPDLVVPAELITRVTTRIDSSTVLLAMRSLVRFIYFGKGTDVRPTWSTPGADTIEFPAGSGRFYQTIDVDDVAKGLPNEFRVASVLVVAGPAGGWPIPIP